MGPPKWIKSLLERASADHAPSAMKLLMDQYPINIRAAAATLASIVGRGHESLPSEWEELGRACSSSVATLLSDLKWSDTRSSYRQAQDLSMTACACIKALGRMGKSGACHVAAV